VLSFLRFAVLGTEAGDAHRDNDLQEIEKVADKSVVNTLCKFSLLNSLPGI
jgi:hypothetical protein